MQLLGSWTSGSSVFAARRVHPNSLFVHHRTWMHVSWFRSMHKRQLQTGVDARDDRKPTLASLPGMKSLVHNHAFKLPETIRGLDSNEGPKLSRSQHSGSRKMSVRQTALKPNVSAARAVAFISRLDADINRKFRHLLPHVTWMTFLSAHIAWPCTSCRHVRYKDGGLVWNQHSGVNSFVLLQ